MLLLHAALSPLSQRSNPFVSRCVRVFESALVSQMVFLAVVSDHGLALYVTGVAGARA